VLSGSELYGFLKTVLPFYSFRLYMHVLSSPFLDLLCQLPSSVKTISQVYLDGEKSSVNDRAVKQLARAGYQRIYYVNRLHGKVIIVGSQPNYIIVGTSNLTGRALRNYELVLVLEDPSWDIYEEVLHVFVKPVESAKYIPPVLETTG